MNRTRIGSALAFAALLILLVALISLVTARPATADSPHPTTTSAHHEQQDGCDHGATGKDCKPDPQPTHGKDCETHGNHGGVNEDHCDDETTSTSSTTSSSSTTSPSSTTSSTSSTTTSSTTSTTTSPTSSAPPRTLGLAGWDVDCTKRGTRLTLWAYDTSDAATWTWRIVASNAASEQHIDAPNVPIQRVYDVRRGDTLRVTVQQLLDGEWASLATAVVAATDCAKLTTHTPSSTSTTAAPVAERSTPVAHVSTPPSTGPQLAHTGTQALLLTLTALPLLIGGGLLSRYGARTGRH